MSSMTAVSDGSNSRAGTGEPDSVFEPPRLRGDAPWVYARPEWIHQFFYHDTGLSDGAQRSWPDYHFLPARYLQINAAEETEPLTLPPLEGTGTRTDIKSQERHDQVVWQSSRAADALGHDRSFFGGIEPAQSGISVAGSYVDQARGNRLTSLQETPTGRGMSPLETPTTPTVAHQNVDTEAEDASTARHAAGSAADAEPQSDALENMLAMSAPKKIPQLEKKVKAGLSHVSPTEVGSLAGSFQELMKLSSTPSFHPLRRTRSDYLQEPSRRSVLALSGHKLFNPYQMPDSQADSNRWVHAFPRAYAKSDYPFGPPWKSLCTPACLPLTIINNIDQINFDRDYKTTHTYTLQFFEHWSGRSSKLGFRQALKHIFVLLQAQRLSQGFQLCVTRTSEEAAAADKANNQSSSSDVQDKGDTSDNQAEVGPLETSGASKSSSSVSRTPLAVDGTPLYQRRRANAGRLTNSSSMSGVFRLNELLTSKHGTVHGVKDNDNNAHWMSCGVQFHKIALDPSGGSVNVEVQQLKSSLEIRIPKYTYELIPYRRTKPTTMTTDLSSYAIDSYNWNTADHLISTQVTDVMSSSTVESQMFWRVRYVILPKSVNEKGDTADRFRGLVEDIQRILTPHIAKVADGSFSACLHCVEQVQVKLVDTPEELNDKQIMSEYLWLDIDPARNGDRDEWALFYFDEVYHPSRVFHIECQWLVATACTIQSLFEKIRKRADARGMLLAPVPVEQLGRVGLSVKHDTLRLPLELKLPLEATFGTRDLTEFQWRLLEDSLVTTLDLLLDTAAEEADGKPQQDLGPRGSPLNQQRQYVHRSGNAMVMLDREQAVISFVTNYLAQGKRWNSVEEPDLRAVLSGKKAVSEVILALQLILLTQNSDLLKLLVQSQQTEASLKQVFFDWWGQQPFNVNELLQGLSVTSNEMELMSGLHRQAKKSNSD
eukprot:TRINITY_DN10313_c0_g1_i1.p1 TRINITY_DN10313_c0_g1~~TRINITY_DN10313_c0_g1_i1.p1  ORF type:complete len:940 (+),score=176.11 TRINITY_DN10313_c0_g1_i1:133-2952(+)